MNSTTSSENKCKYYMFEKDVSDEYEKSWLDEIESKHGQRPRIFQTIAASPERVTHYCSAQRLTEIVHGRVHIQDHELFPEELEEELNNFCEDTMVDFYNFWSRHMIEDTIDGTYLGEFDIDNQEGYMDLREAMSQHGG